MITKENLKKVLGKKCYKLYKNKDNIKNFTDREIQENEHDYMCEIYNTLLNNPYWSYYSELYSIFKKERKKRNLNKLPRLFAL